MVEPASIPVELAQLIAGSPPRSIDSIARALTEGVIPLDAPAGRIERLPDVSRETAMRASVAFLTVRDLLDAAGVALALGVGNELRRLERLDRPDIEIAWSGPEAEGPLVRPTGLVIDEMLRRVRDAGEVLIVGYSLTAKEGTIMADIVQLLQEASKRRARITLVLHKDQEAANKTNLLQLWDVFVKKPLVYTWTPPPDHPYTKLHAKVLVVDRLEALVGSANFTFHGLESNLELGLRVRGPQAAAIAERFDHLIASGVLELWK